MPPLTSVQLGVPTKTPRFKQIVFWSFLLNGSTTRTRTLFRTSLCHRSGANKKGQPLTTTGEGGGKEGLTANRKKHLVAILRVEPLHLSTFPTLSHGQPELGFSISEYVVR